MQRTRNLLIASLLAAASSLAAALLPDRAQEELLEQRAEALANHAIRDQAAAGLSMAVGSGGRLTLATGFGYEGWDPEARATEDTAYRVGPLLEHFLSVAILRLVQDGKLALDDPLEELLPDLREEPWKGVQLRHLLAQTSGIPSYARLLTRPGVETFPREQALAFLGLADLDDAPGTCFEPSPSNQLLLGLILESKTERGVQDWTAEQLFAPLDLDATHWCWTGRGPRVQGAELLPFGAEGLCTSAADLVRWIGALVDGRVLDGEHFELLTSPTQLADGTWTAEGLGLRSGQHEGLRRYALSSTYAGSHVQLAYYPDRDLAVAVCASGEAVSVSAIEQSLGRAALGLPEPGISDLALSAEEQAPYLGGFYVGCNRLGIVSHGQRLRLETAEGPCAVLLHQGEHRFVARDDPGLSLVFELENSRATSFVLDNHGTRTTARRID